MNVGDTIRSLAQQWGWGRERSRLRPAVVSWWAQATGRTQLGPSKELCKMESGVVVHRPHPPSFQGAELVSAMPEGSPQAKGRGTQALEVRLTASPELL